MRAKYSNKKTTLGGIVFDSAKEARRWRELTLLEKSGKISGLSRQVVFELAPSVIIGGRKKPALRYVCDFTYQCKEQFIAEDVKGVKTAAYIIKRHLMKSVYGLNILET